MNNHYAKVPTIIGFTTNEGSDQVKKDTDTEEQFRTYLQDHYPLLTNDDLTLLVKTFPNERHWRDSGRLVMPPSAIVPIGNCQLRSSRPSSTTCGESPRTGPAI